MGPSERSRAALHAPSRIGAMSRLRSCQLLHCALLCALLLAALAPGVARAMAALQGDAQPWSVVCSAGAGGNASGLPGGDLAHGEPHCSHCLLQNDASALPPAAPAALPLLRLSLAVPALFLHAPRPLPAWQSAQARAPPQTA